LRKYLYNGDRMLTMDARASDGGETSCVTSPHTPENVR
jgi:hypothetical protein